MCPGGSGRRNGDVEINETCFAEGANRKVGAFVLHLRISVLSACRARASILDRHASGAYPLNWPFRTITRPGTGGEKMKAVIFPGERKVQFLDFPDPTPGPGEVVLEIKASGMCGSDLKFYRAVGGASLLGLGKVSGPIIAGHEPCGVVVAVGPGVAANQARVGMRVMQHHYRGCGVCEHCSTGWMQLCVEGVKEVYGATGHGAHARYMKCPARTLVPLPDELSFDAGAAISCGTGTAWGALHRLALQGNHTIAVFGQGPAGLSPPFLAPHTGAPRIAPPTPPQRLPPPTHF